MSITITKMSGTGNSFLIVNSIDNSFVSKNLSDLSINLCKKYKTDGMVFLKSSHNVDFAWDFYNLDGSVASMCGNAARCVVMYSLKNGISKNNKVQFEAGQRIVKGQVIDDNSVRVFLGQPKVVKELTVSNFSGFLVDSGVPHFVAEVEDIHDAALLEAAENIQNSNSLTENANITFYKDHMIKTFEKGVQGFTMACGTGAVAVGATLIFLGKHKFNDHISLKAPGGMLTVSVLDNYQDASLTGNVETLDVFEDNI